MLLSKVRAKAKQVVVIAACREENERQVQAHLGNLFENLKLIRIPHFNTDPHSNEAAQIIDEFERQGADHKRDWDGNIGSLVLGLSRKKRMPCRVLCNPTLPGRSKIPITQNSAWHQEKHIQ